MKKLLLLFLISVGINAQFNYQAIVKDSDGNPVTNNQVKFKFSLMYQSSTATPVFIEELNEEDMPVVYKKNAPKS